MIAHDPHLSVRLARSEADLKGAQRLRYKVFVEELGGDGPLVDHDAQLEVDVHDPHYAHLVLVDDRRASADLEHVVGVYRLMPGDTALVHGYYCAGEYDLSALTGSGRKLLELGRSCLHPDYRGGSAMYLLWQALARYIQEQGIEVLFGVASFHGTDLSELAAPLSLLRARYLAPEDLRVRSLDYQRMELLPEAEIDRRAATAAIPALIKAYLRLGGFVGDGAFIDRPFNTTDVCLILDIARMDPRLRAQYAAAV
ncbi:MAG: GNAT family N-acyltransferase [Pseudomonadota bacterium]